MFLIGSVKDCSLSMLLLNLLKIIIIIIIIEMTIIKWLFDSLVLGVCRL